MSDATEQPEWQWVESEDGRYWIFQLGHERNYRDGHLWVLAALAKLANECGLEMELGHGFVVSPVWTEGYVCMIEEAEGLCLFGEDRAVAEQAVREWLEWQEAAAEDYDLDYRECTWMRLDVTFGSDDIDRLNKEIRELRKLVDLHAAGEVKPSYDDVAGTVAAAVRRTVKETGQNHVAREA